MTTLNTTSKVITKKPITPTIKSTSALSKTYKENAITELQR